MLSEGAPKAIADRTRVPTATAGAPAWDLEAAAPVVAVVEGEGKRPASRGNYGEHRY